MPRFLASLRFWLGFGMAAAITGLFFTWELGALSAVLPFLPPSPPLPPKPEYWYTGILAFLLSVNTGLILWQASEGSCPIGVKRASGVAGLIGAFTLICPVCIVLPASLLGIGAAFVLIAPFLPLLRLIAILLLVVSLYLLWPKQNMRQQ